MRCFMVCLEKTRRAPACPEPRGKDRMFRESTTAKCRAATVLHSVHWLPVRSRTDFKLATLRFKSPITGQPVYLAESLHPYQPQRSLRSSSLNLLTVPYCRTKLDRRRFSAAAPRVWNSLSGDLRTDYDPLRTLKNNNTFLYRNGIT